MDHPGRPVGSRAGRPPGDLGVGSGGTVGLLKLPQPLFATALCALMGLLLVPLPALTQDGFAALCPFFVQKNQDELDNLELAVELDETRLLLAQEIFVLLDGLWKNDAVERLTYLEGKHHRDAAEVTLERARQRVVRQHAVMEQYRLGCSAGFADEHAPQSQPALERAFQNYVEADCEVRALDVAVVEVNLEHHQENLKSILELRASEIASRLQVLLAERDVELMLKELAQARQRRCLGHHDC